MLERIIEYYPEEELLTADGFDDAIIGVDDNSMNSEAVICYDQDKCIEILAKNMSSEDAVEYFYFNVAGSYVGKKTPKFIKLF